MSRPATETVRATFHITVQLVNDREINGEWDEELVPDGAALAEGIEDWLYREIRPWTAEVTVVRSDDEEESDG